MAFFTKRELSALLLLGILLCGFSVPIFLHLSVRPWLAVIFSLSALPGVLLFRLASRFLADYCRRPIIESFSKFSLIGILNTCIDFGTLNLLSSLAGVRTGAMVGVINSIGVLAAVVNSYLWNKFWVFKLEKRSQAAQDLPMFLAVTMGNVLINGFLVVALTGFQNPFGISPELWLNASKIIAAPITILLNFTGYKLLVFK
ncbi:MAG TPA: GtrA family protein [Candidatus Paceibacterota bacterium]|nr:GtrA family protein [Candidatus Paceibacterota bacterium]